MNSFDVLVIVLSVALALFIIVSIVATIKFINLLDLLNTSVQKADKIVDDVNKMADSIKNVATGSVMAGMLSAFLTKIIKKPKK